MNVEPRPAEETYPNLAGFALDPNPALVALTRQCREALAEINRLRVEVERLEQRMDGQRAALDLLREREIQISRAERLLLDEVRDRVSRR